MEVDEFSPTNTRATEGGAPRGQQLVGKNVWCVSLCGEPTIWQKKAPGEYSWRGEDKNVSPPEHDNDAKKGIERSSKVRKITFTLITLLDKSSVDEIGDRCAKP